MLIQKRIQFHSAHDKSITFDIDNKDILLTDRLIKERFQQLLLLLSIKTKNFCFVILEEIFHMKKI
jgi:hypothetical protein